MSLCRSGFWFNGFEMSVVSTRVMSVCTADSYSLIGPTAAWMDAVQPGTGGVIKSANLHASAQQGHWGVAKQGCHLTCTHHGCVGHDIV